jgi:3-oxoacyl-[acyl-carrier-protein] synthase III
MSIVISAIAPWVPERLVSVTDLGEDARLNEVETQTFRGLGIDTIAQDDSLTAADLATRAAEGSLRAGGLAATDVDALVVVQPRIPEFFMASEATRVQAAIGASRAMTFTVADLGCVSVSAALMTGRALLKAGEDLRTVLVAHGSKSPTPRRYRHPVTINGEGGIAFLLTHGEAPEIVDISLETDGSYWDLFRVRYRDIPYSQWYEECTSTKDYSFKLAIESRNRFTRMNDELLSRHGLGLGDVDHFVMQNLSVGAFHFYEEVFDIAFAKACKTNLQRYGHLGSMDVVLNLHTAVETGEFAPGNLVLVMNNSPVAAWSSMLVRI